MLTRIKPKGRRTGARRLRLVVPALLCLAPLTMAPIGSATADDGDEEDCYNLDDECIPFTQLTENTRVFLARTEDGSTQGFTDWSEYEAFVEDATDLDIELEDGKVVVNEDDDDDDGDGDSAAGRGGRPSAPGGIGFFFARGDLKGDALVDGAPHFIPDLSKVPYRDGLSWNNRISSVRTHGAVALLCMRKNCATTGPVTFFTVPDGVATRLLGGLNNSASAIGVF